MVDGPMIRLLFACVENACRSQMAGAFARHLAGEKIHASSGGTDPASEVDEEAVRVMGERGIDISHQKPGRIDPEELGAADLVVTMGCGPDACPAAPPEKVREWDVEDPHGKSIEDFRKCRDEIEERVRELLDEIIPEK